jgi:hypothetical protein
MTLQELREELDRNMDLNSVHASGQLPALAEDAHRLQVVDELLKRPSDR